MEQNELLCNLTYKYSLKTDMPPQNVLSLHPDPCGLGG